MPSQQESFNFWDFADSTRAPGSGVDQAPGAAFTFPFGGRPGMNFGPWAAPPPHPPHPGHHRHSHGRHGHHGHHGHHGGRGGRGRFHGGGFHPFEAAADVYIFDDEAGEDERRRGRNAAANQNQNETETKGDAEKEKSPNTMQEDTPDPAEVTPDEDEQTNPPPYANWPFGARGGCGRRGRGCPRSERRGFPQPPPGNFDFSNFLREVTNHPFVHHIGEAASRYGQAAQPSDPNTFSPPVDTFNTETAYVLHVALPGAKKSDIGVNWNPETSELSILGVVHRPGDEEFLKTQLSTERRVGVFERVITLPPTGVTEKEEIDGEAITAKMEDGVLIVTVPKVEKEWTEIRKVDIA